MAFLDEASISGIALQGTPAASPRKGSPQFLDETVITGMGKAEPTFMENLTGFLGEKATEAGAAAKSVGEFLSAGIGMVGGSVAGGLRTAEELVKGKPRREALQEGAATAARVGAALNPVTVATQYLGYKPDPTVIEDVMGKIAKGIHGYGERIESTYRMPDGSPVVMAEDVDALANVMLGALAGKATLGGVKAGAKKYYEPTRPGTAPGARESYAAPEAPEPSAVGESGYQQPVAPLEGPRSAAEAIAASKARVRDLKAAVKAETPAEKASRMAAVAPVSVGEGVWESGGVPYPVKVTGDPIKAANGKSYTPVEYNGMQSFVPTEELRPPTAPEPQVGLPTPPDAIGSQAGQVPKTRMTEAAVTPPTELDSAILKLKNGQAFDLTATEQLALKATQKAGGRIVGPDGKPIGSGFDQAGGIDKRLLTALGISSAAVWAAMSPEGQERLSDLGVIGVGITLGSGKGGGRSLSALRRDAMPYWWKTLDHLDDSKIEFSKEEVLGHSKRQGVSAAEQAMFQRVIAAAPEGKKITAHDLTTGLIEETAGWKLTAEKTEQYADYGLENIGKQRSAGYNGDPLYDANGNPIGKSPNNAITTKYRLPEHMQMSDANHFSDDRLFGWTRSFSEGNVRHVVEIQSDLAQHAKALTPEKQAELLKTGEELQHKMDVFRDFYAKDIRTPEHVERTLDRLEPFDNLAAKRIAGIADQMLLGGPGPKADAVSRPQAYLRELAALAEKKGLDQADYKNALREGFTREFRELEQRIVENKTALGAAAVGSQLGPILKNWPRRLIREELLNRHQEILTAQSRFPEKTLAIRATQEAQRTGDAAKFAEARDTITEIDKSLLEKPVVRFASADTVAKVEGWREAPEGGRASLEGRQFINPAHQSIYKRYAGEITSYLKSLGGVEVRDAQGHTWWEVPTSSVTLKGRPQIHQFGKADPKLLAAVTAGIAAGAYLLNDGNAENLALAGIGGVVAAKGKGAFAHLAEADLIAAARAGKQGAFTELYKRNEPQLRRTLQSYARAGADIDDLVQRTFVSAFSHLDDFRGESKLSTWLHRIGQNKAKNVLEAERVRPSTTEITPEMEQTLGHGETPARALETKALGTQLETALEKVEPSFREAFLMKEAEGLSYEEIAAKQGVPVGTVRSRISRAKDQLQGYLREYKGDFAQRGEADPKVLAGIAAVAGGAALGAYLDPESPVHGAFYGMLGGAALTRVSPRGVADLIARVSSGKELVKIDDLARSTVYARKVARRETYKLSYGLEQAIPEVARREAIFRHLDGDTSIQLNGTELKAAAQVKEFYNNLGEKAKAAGVIRELLDNYATRIYGPESRSLLATKIVGSGMTLDSPFGKRRAFPTLAEAEAAGHIPVTTDIAKVLEAYSESVTAALENRKFVETLKATTTGEGISLIAKEGKAPEGYVFIDHPQLRGLRVHPDIAADLRFIFDAKEVGPILRTLDAINTTQKRMAVSFSLFHAAALEHAMLGATSIMRSPARAVRIAAQSFAPDLFGENLAVRMIREGGAGDLVDSAMKAGLQFGFELQSPALQELRSGFYEMMKGTSDFLDKTVPGLGTQTVGRFVQLNHIFDRAMWGRFHAAMKLETFADKVSELSRNNARMNESGKGPLKSAEEIARDAASFTNDVFGGLNWHGIVQEMGSRWSRELASAAFSPSGRLGMRMLMFAPDWTISTTRAFLKAFGHEGMVAGAGAVLGAQVDPNNKLIGGALGTLLGVGVGKALGLKGTGGSGLRGLIQPTELADLHRQYILRSAFIYTAIVDTLNVQMSGHHIWDNKDPTRLDRGDGTTQQVSKHFMEPIHWLLTPRQQALNKLSFVVKEPATQIMDTEYLSVHGAPRMGKTPKGEEIPLGTRLKHVARGFDPISVQQSYEGGAGRSVAGFLGAPIYGKTPEERAAVKLEAKQKAVQRRIDKRMKEQTR